jgi:hypothetical protein
LKSVTWYQEVDAEFIPSDRTEYTYDVDGYLMGAKHFYYDNQLEEYVLRSKETFTYNNDNLRSITQVTEGTNAQTFVEYDYKNGSLYKIFVDQDINTTITIKEAAGDTVEAFYAHSNGRSFTYRFCYTDNNIVYEETWNDSGKKSSEIVNEFDNMINPYSLLGFVDPFFTNYSKSNKVKTEEEYFNEAFPESVPSDFTYEYLDTKLPSQQIITYKSYPNGEIVTRAKRVFEYQ